MDNVLLEFRSWWSQLKGFPDSLLAILISQAQLRVDKYQPKKALQTSSSSMLSKTNATGKYSHKYLISNAQWLDKMSQKEGKRK